MLYVSTWFNNNLLIDFTMKFSQKLKLPLRVQLVTSNQISVTQYHNKLQNIEFTMKTYKKHNTGHDVSRFYEFFNYFDYFSIKLVEIY